MKTLVALTVLNIAITALNLWNTELRFIAVHGQVAKVNQTVNTIAIFGSDKTYQHWKSNN